MRRALATGGSGAILILIMLGGGIVLWVGVPVGWLYIGSQIQVSTGSLGTAMAVMMIGAIVSILAIVAALIWLNRSTSTCARCAGSRITARPLWRRS